MVKEIISREPIGYVHPQYRLYEFNRNSIQGDLLGAALVSCNLPVVVGKTEFFHTKTLAIDPQITQDTSQQQRILQTREVVANVLQSEEWSLLKSLTSSTGSVMSIPDGLSRSATEALQRIAMLHRMSERVKIWQARREFRGVTTHNAAEF